MKRKTFISPARPLVTRHPPRLGAGRARSYVTAAFRRRLPPRTTGTHRSSSGAAPAEEERASFAWYLWGGNVPQTQSWLKSDVAQQLGGRDSEEWDGRQPNGPRLLWCSEDARVEAALLLLLLSLINPSESLWMYISMSFSRLRNPAPQDSDCFTAASINL